MIDVKATLCLWRDQLTRRSRHRYRLVTHIEILVLALVAPLDAKIASWFVSKPSVTLAPPTEHRDAVTKSYVDECAVPATPFKHVTPMEVAFLSTGSRPMTRDLDTDSSAIDPFDPYCNPKPPPCRKHQHQHTFNANTGWSDCTRCGAVRSGVESLRNPQRSITVDVGADVDPTGYQLRVAEALNRLRAFTSHAPVEMYRDGDDPLCLTCRVAPLAAKESLQEGRCIDCRKQGKVKPIDPSEVIEFDCALLREGPPK